MSRLHLFALTGLTMSAFAMNSVLNRAAVEGGHADPASFAVLRTLAGVLMLGLLVAFQRRSFGPLTPRRIGGGLALAVYMIGFSWAYLSLDAGLGALILFGTVQIVLFAHTALTQSTPTRRQALGGAVAFAGLLLALWPGAGAEGTVTGAGAMLLAGLGWAAYTLAGRGASDPVAATGLHFLLSLPLVCLLLLTGPLAMSLLGAGLAIVAGALTSALGYALWYSVLPSLQGARAGVVQLSVPILAIVLGAALLGEPVGLKVALAAVLVVGGIGFALISPKAPAGHSSGPSLGQRPHPPPNRASPKPRGPQPR